MENNIKLEHPVTFRWLMLFALPTIISTIFMNLYSTVDGVFGTMVQMSYITVGKAKMGLYLNIIGGVLNIVLDWLFIAVMGMSLVMTVLYFRKYRSVWTETK